MSFLRRHFDELLALGLALLFVAEVLRVDTPRTGPAVALALLAGLALAWRRTLTLVAFLACVGGLTAVLVVAPALDGDTIRILDQAEQIADKAGDSYVTVERLLLALVLAKARQ
jgi:hypothetical protein